MSFKFELMPSVELVVVVQADDAGGHAVDVPLSRNVVPLAPGQQPPHPLGQVAAGAPLPLPLLAQRLLHDAPPHGDVPHEAVHVQRVVQERLVLVLGGNSIDKICAKVHS